MLERTGSPVTRLRASVLPPQGSFSKRLRCDSPHVPITAAWRVNNGLQRLTQLLELGLEFGDAGMQRSGVLVVEDRLRTSHGHSGPGQRSSTGPIGCWRIISSVSNSTV